ncbi:mitochondrial glycoprotein family protein [Striga asiatica]|uniref:Mitochondrial glycoprotein family protein n=1 Tax=Striga asiatica TaxID=4170 RepID=A0A5A7P0W4_STRAF|nr:mitochondrial glycoprotein family protein [Striga asiatica]
MPPVISMPCNRIVLSYPSCPKVAEARASLSVWTELEPVDMSEKPVFPKIAHPNKILEIICRGQDRECRTQKPFDQESRFPIEWDHFLEDYTQAHGHQLETHHLA